MCPPSQIVEDSVEKGPLLRRNASCTDEAAKVHHQERKQQFGDGICAHARDSEPGTSLWRDAGESQRHTNSTGYDTKALSEASI